MGFDNSGNWVEGTPTEKLSVKPDAEFQVHTPEKHEKEGFIKSNKTPFTPYTPCTRAASSLHSSRSEPTQIKDSEGSKQKEIDKESPKKKTKRDHLTDSKLARNMADLLQDFLCFDEISLDWCAYVGGIWGEISKTRALKIIDQQLHQYLPDGFSMAKLNGIEAFLRIYLSVSSWKVKRNLLPLKNGVLDAETMKLQDYSPEFRFRWQLPYHYQPESKIKIIENWLQEVTQEDQELINTIRAFFKITLTGGDIQRFLEVIGPGGTGKSTLERLLIMLVGEVNCVATDLKNLEQNRFETASLYGKRLAIISDSSRYGGEVSVLKALTGGDPIRLERKNQQQAGSFVFEGTVIIVSNEAIQSSDYSSGLARRRLPVIFSRKVTDEDKKKWRSMGGIENAMKAELPGLLNWVLSMSDEELMSTIGSINGEMTKTQLKHICETNKLAAWIEDNLIISKESVTYIGASTARISDAYDKEKAEEEKLYPNYQAWCSDSEIKPVSLKRFSKDIIDVCEHLKLPVEKLPRSNQGNGIKGLIIRKPQHVNEPTPVTRELLNNNSCSVSEGSVKAETPASAGCAGCEGLNLSEKNLEDI